MNKDYCKLNLLCRCVPLCLLLLFPASLFAGDGSIAQISGDLMGPTAIITKMVLVACYMVGVGLIIFSLAQYKQHKQNAKLVPLGTPIILFILGAGTLLIPYFSIASGDSASASEQEKRDGKTAPKSGALPPIAEPVKRRLPGPGRYTPSDVEQDDDYDPDDGDDYDVPSSGHWTDSYD